MSVEQWLGLASLVLVLAGIVVRVERRMGKALTREEHEKICKERNDRVERQFSEFREEIAHRHEENSAKLDRLADLIERSNESATEHRHRMADQILTLVEKVGSIQGRLGVDEFKRRGG